MVNRTGKINCRAGSIKPGMLLAGGFAAALIGPFLIPVPPLKNTRPSLELADPDSLFVQINGLNVHLKTMGQGEPVFVLLHGFGASLSSWHTVMQPLSQQGTVIAYDRPAFGLTERPLTWKGQNPYGNEAQIALLLGLLEHFGIQRNVILVGNSAGGTVAMQTARLHPGRVSALILVDPLVYGSGGAPGWLKPLLATPQMRHLGPLLMRLIQLRGPEILQIAWHNPSQLTPETIEMYQRPLQSEHWDRALWEFNLATHPPGLARRLKELNLPTLVVTGDDDRIVPTMDSVRLAGELPNARLAVIPEAGHVPHEEQPQKFLDAVGEFLNKIKPGLP